MVGTKGIYNIVAVGGEDSDAVWIVPIMIRDAIPVRENLAGGDKSPGADEVVRLRGCRESGNEEDGEKEKISGSHRLNVTSKG